MISLARSSATVRLSKARNSPVLLVKPDKVREDFRCLDMAVLSSRRTSMHCHGDSAFPRKHPCIKLSHKAYQLIDCRSHSLLDCHPECLEQHQFTKTSSQVVEHLPQGIEVLLQCHCFAAAQSRNRRRRSALMRSNGRLLETNDQVPDPDKFR